MEALSDDSLASQPQAILDALPFQMAVLDQNGIILRVNAAWTEFARANGGYVRTETGVGLDYLAACEGDRRGRRVAREIRRVLRGDAAEFATEYPCHSAQQKRWFILRIAALRPAGNGAVVAHYEITERVRAERELRRSRAKLKLAKNAAVRSERSKAEFLAQMSHEVRTPLNGIFGMIEMLRDTRLDGEQRATVDHLNALADHLLGVVNDVLDLAKLEAGSFVFEQSPFDPGAVAAEVCDILRRTASGKGLALSWHPPPDFPRRVLGDARRVRQILLNLTDNAIKFTDRGSVRITARALPAEDGERGLEFSVEDTGIGIAPEAQKRLFQRFSQIAAGKTGSGLGLVISKHIAEAMGGGIALDSAPGRGSAFKVSIRVRTVEPEEATTAAREPREGAGAHAAARSGTILVAEDNEVNRKIMAAILETLGWSALLAKDGQEALELLEQGDVAAVFMDCQMPRLDGFAATAAIRRKESIAGRARLPIIAITADAMEESLKRCRDAGMDECLLKPFKRREVAELLDRLALPGLVPVHPDTPRHPADEAGS
jgi:signal transduction histidine kinase/CheY-like chemotaxis protein